MNIAKGKVVVTLHCKECDDKQNILVDKDKADKLEKIKNKIVCDKCIIKGQKI